MALDRFYFDTVQNKCLKFIYGGCKGNANNFESKTECDSKCHSKPPKPSDVCKLEEEAGTCRAYTERYFYDSAKKKCLTFIFGGCGGNGNNFLSEEACRKTCNESDFSFVTAIPRVLEDCGQPMKKGDCGGNIDMFAFDVNVKKCVPFKYSGCGGSLNLFFTKNGCEKVCLAPTASTTTELPPVKKNSSLIFFLSPQFKQPNVEFDLEDCLLKSVKGHCSGNVTRFYYDHEERECFEFAYSGCSGNKNNFVTRLECVETCHNAESRIADENATVCEMPIKRGPCEAKLARFAYDARNEECVEFDYGGCGGNRNRFLSKAACEGTCGSPAVEGRVEEAEESGESAFAVAEAVIGVALALLFLFEVESI